ncbi:SpoIID/LytB domain-containing protein [Patescibacteria group bacterium]|nr:SpoIID/LytB domain-containing protein [Patescibacteria group bacterium]
MMRYAQLLGIFLVALVVGGGATRSVLATSEYAAQWVAQAEKVSLKTGETKQVWIELKNTGLSTWKNSGDNAVKIGTVRKRDRNSNLRATNWLSDNRLASTAETEIAPGEVGKFVFDITSGTLAQGNYREYFGLVAEGVTWFEGFEFYIDVDAKPAVITGELVSTPPPIILKTGETQVVNLNLKNTGDITWANGGPNAIKIGTAKPLDRRSLFRSSSWLSDNRAAMASMATAPGGIAEFNFTISAPSKPGKYVENFAVVAEGLAWLPQSDFGIEVTVQPAIYSASFARQSEPVSLTPGTTATLWVELINKGNTIWKATGDNATKLGTARALDRESLFYDSSWLSNNRVATVDKDVAPGETGRFSFTVRAPEQIGTYKEYFRPVIENVAWMEDMGIYWEITVNEELKLLRPIRVGLNSTTNSMTISSSNGMVIRRGDGRGLVERITNSQLVVVTAISGGYSINIGGSARSIDDYLRFIPLKNSVITVSNDGVSSSYNRFRGIIAIRRSSYSGNVWLVNELELEDYLRGLAEVPDSWPMEARKAQVIAARTFAVRRINDPKADIFDIYDDTRDQVYYGFNYETNRPGISQAVDATLGLLVLYNGQPALTYYHSDSGGATENVENVWSSGNPAKAIPYLKGVADSYAKPVTWEATLSQGYVQNRFSDQLAKVGAGAGETVVGMMVDDRYPSGRLKSVTLTTSTGKRATMDLNTFDYLTDSNYIKSMNLTIITTGPDNGPDFVLSGKGNGHGIGLSQWSSYNMAAAGQTAEQILKYFYSGISVGVA